MFIQICIPAAGKYLGLEAFNHLVSSPHWDCHLFIVSIDFLTQGNAVENRNRLLRWRNSIFAGAERKLFLYHFIF